MTHQKFTKGDPGGSALPTNQASEAVPPHLIPTLARYAELKRYQDYFDSKQYEGRPDFWTGKDAEGRVVPLRERAPCIVYPLPRNAVRQTSRFMLGEEQWPALRVEHAEGDEAEGDEGDGSDGADEGISEEDAEALRTGLEEIVAKARLRSIFKHIVERGLASCTSVAVLSLRRGRFVVDRPHARDCSPTFEGDDPGQPVKSMVWAYRFQKQVLVGTMLVPRTFWFRRDFTADATLIYEPVEDKGTPVWGAPKVEPHGLGFCPVLWFRNAAPDNGSLDGTSLYHGLLNEIDAVNLALSQRHKGIHFHGTPQPYETGVEPGDGPEANARRADAYSPDDKGATHGQVAGPARAKGPDHIWSYQGESVRVSMLETSGASFEVTSKHVEDVRSRALEAMGVVIFNAESTIAMGSSDMSAKLLRLIYAPLLALIGDMRADTWGPALIDLLSMMVRMIVAVGGRGVRLRSARKLARLGARFTVRTASGVEGEEPIDVWSFPDVELIWGSSFEASPNDIASGIDSATKAKDGGHVARKTAATFVAPFFGVKDVDAELKLIDRERAAAQAESVKGEAARAKAVAEATPPKPPVPEQPEQEPTQESHE